MLPDAFQRVCENGIPATLVTASKSGRPNVAFLSCVYYVDPEHVALSFQFFNKSKRNVSEQPKARVALIDPEGRQTWSLDVEYEETQTSGELFERMDMILEAIASAEGMSDVFKLRGADVYRVLSVKRRPFVGTAA